MELTRLNKYLSDSGECSRREADRLIEAGRVTVDGKTAEVGMKVTGREEIMIDSRPVYFMEQKVVLACNKEKGIVCSTVDQGRQKNNLVDRIAYPIRVYPIGRLDKDSEGLILLTNDGSLVNHLLKGSGGHEKEYEVVTDKAVDDEVIDRMRAGGLELIEGRKTRPCRIKRLGDREFNIVLTEGMNRQIRRMFEAFGFEVTSLKRIRFDCITLGSLKPGEYRELSKEEIERLSGDIERTVNG